jgi:transcription termination factor Rho
LRATLSLTDRRTTVDHLKSMTVAELKSIAERMSIPFNSRIKKADLIDAILVQVETDHIRAIEDDEFLFPQPKTFNALTVQQRMQNYKKQNKYLTARQQRRIVKKYSKGLKRGFSLETVTGFAF